VYTHTHTSTQVTNSTTQNIIK